MHLVLSILASVNQVQEDFASSMSPLLTEGSRRCLGRFRAGAVGSGFRWVFGIQRARGV